MFPSATDKCIRCYRLRDLLSLVGGYVFVGTVIINSTILPGWSFCPRGVNTPSLFVAYFFRKNSNRFWWIFKMFIISLVSHLNFNRASLVHLGTKHGEKTKKTRTYTHGSRETPKSERRTFAKNVPRLCISTSLKARFDKRMQMHSMPI